MRRLRQYGWSSKYLAAETGGRNSRLDELQAALLRVKLPQLDSWNQLRRERAGWYQQGLAHSGLDLPPDEPGHVYHLYVVGSDERDGLREQLIAARVGCDIQYPVPAHLQPAYRETLGQSASLTHTERAAGRILSLPMYPELTYQEIERVCAAVRGSS